jgi:hypothetical protein
MMSGLLQTGMKPSNKAVTQFHGRVFMYLQSEAHRQNVKELFSSTNPTAQQSNAAFQIVCHVRDIVVSLAAKSIRETPLALDSSTTSSGSAAGRSKIRYIGGWCVATLKHQKKLYVSSNLYANKSQPKITRTLTQIQSLEHLEANEWELSQNTCDPTSLLEISRKQNVRQGLTNITDSSFSFFLHLDAKIRNMESVQSAQLHGEALYVHIRQSVEKDLVLVAEWVELLRSPNTVGHLVDDMQSGDAIRTLYNDVVQKFLRISCGQFRKEYLHILTLQKEEAHRKQIQMKSTKPTCSSNWNFAQIISDVTLNKIASHRRLQAELLRNPDSLVDGPFLKDQLIKLT